MRVAIGILHQVMKYAQIHVMELTVVEILHKMRMVVQLKLEQEHAEDPMRVELL